MQYAIIFFAWCLLEEQKAISHSIIYSKLECPHDDIVKFFSAILVFCWPNCLTGFRSCSSFHEKYGWWYVIGRALATHTSLINFDFLVVQLSLRLPVFVRRVIKHSPCQTEKYRNTRFFPLSAHLWEARLSGKFFRQMC